MRASGRCLDVVRILRMSPGNRHVEAVALRCQAVLEAMRGRADAAGQILDGCRATLEELGLTLELHELALYAGMVDLLAGRPAEAEASLRQAKEGCFPLDRMQDFTRDYLRAGGTAAFSDYYKVHGDKARFDPALVEPVVFAQHNLVSDGRFNEFHLVLCRNVLIYFDRDLQNRVHDLFHESLVRFGMLALGHKESIRFTSRADDYTALDDREKIYRRVA